MKSYEQYKPSGVAWLGDVPEHWEVKRLKYLLAEKLKYGANESAELDDKDLPRYIRITDIREDGKLKEETFKSLEYEKAEEYLLDNFDILLARSGATVGKSYLYKKSLVGVACYAGYLIRARFKQEISNPEFINYVFQSNFYSAWVKAVNIQATIQNVSAEKYNEFTLALPPLEEQIAIATYLDERTAYLDRLIAKQQALSEKLSEKRTALITEAVCGRVKISPDLCLQKKGIVLSGNQITEQKSIKKSLLFSKEGLGEIGFKDSGIQWLGKIPEHWEVKRLKFVGELQGGIGFPHDYQNIQDLEFGFYKVGDLGLSENNRDMPKAQHTVSIEIADKLGAKIIPENSILYAKVGAALLLNRRRITGEKCCIDNNMTAFIPDVKQILPIWAFYTLSIIDFKILVNPGAIPSLSEGYQKNLSIPMPNLEEQTAIAAFLDKETAKIDCLQAKIAESIARLKEYRSALITQVVTGKIKVQGV
ncbi:hypothetical protein BKG95_07090 [Rodentibacter pneumotropicus]|uniref:Restriction endonuclease subunit S n=1 Tax=Rodentibacter pneumotropicus TaxID=758 RepID=A0AAW5LJ74_9PAST|nr:restriction endonuclease subunit S [Rodentibacter pneumotropicus]MCQ9122346.1 restriction endonuclease subunit S [Rodentibacter pneumotropicus]OOF67492.1 hypothetical protein BKG95_07090 [Rodentibacter pneumotropicus]